MIVCLAYHIMFISFFFCKKIYKKRSEKANGKRKNIHERRKISSRFSRKINDIVIKC